MMKSENKQRSSENLGIFGTFLLIFSFFALLGPIHGNPNGRSFVYQEAQDQAELSFNLSAIHEALDFFTENIMKAKSNSTSTQSRRLLPEEPKFYRAGDNIPDEFDDFPCSFRADEKAHRCAVDCEGDSLNCLPAMKWCAVAVECDAVVVAEGGGGGGGLAVLKRRAPTAADREAARHELEAARKKWGQRALGDAEKRRSYIIASYGGSGSKMFCGLIAMSPARLVNYIWHVHDPEPSFRKLHAPLKHPRLRRVTIKKGQDWRNVQFMDSDLNNKQKMVEIPEDKVDDFRFVFLYRNPIEAMLSRYFYGHCKNLRGDCGASDRQFPSYRQYAKEKGDRMRLEEHYDNYVTKQMGNDNRNYPIIALNYHKLWDQLPEVLDLLGLPSALAARFPPRQEKRRSTSATVGDATVEELARDFGVKFRALVAKVKAMPAVAVI
mmetsp:Transcript_15650/g.25460  ORF Transcript_15650/g.25460 Transcript_15650/m.25460 type:complete len:437 (+) Transcript_15650:103-1413(+)